MKNNKCVQRHKEYDVKQLIRSLGEYSSVIPTGCCSARCYTKKLHDKVETETPKPTLRQDLIAQLRHALHLLETPNVEDTVCFDVFECEFEFELEVLNKPHVVLGELPNV